MTITWQWLFWAVAIALMFVSARWPTIGKVQMFHLAWAFALLAVAWPVLR
jgi:hypothetical protein